MRLKHHADWRILGLQASQNFSRAIARAVVDADQLDLHGNGENLKDYFAEGGAFVINRHYDGKFHGAPDESETPPKSITIVNRTVPAGYCKLGYR
jgi:hypothetical protein